MDTAEIQTSPKLTTAERDRESNRRSYLENREGRIARASDYYRINRDEILAKKKATGSTPDQRFKRAKWRKNNRQKVADQRKRWKASAGYKEHAERRQKNPNRIAYMRAYLNYYNSKNRDKQKAAGRLYYESNKSKCIESARKWEKANPEKRKASVRRNASKNTARTKSWIAANKERHESSRKKYYEAHYDDQLFRNHVRRALVKKATVNLAGIKAWMKSVKSKPTCVCYYCQTVIKTSELHWEHIIPLSKGGPHSVDNLCVSCAPCNLKKGTKSVQAFIVTGQQILSL